MIKKIIKVLGIILLLLIVAAFAIPVLFKDKIMVKVKTTINENINAKADFSGLDISLFRSFPNLTITLNNFYIVGIKDFEGDTLTSIKTVECSVNLMSVITGSTTEIKKIFLDDALVQLLAHKDGKVNWDIAKSSGDETTPSSESKPFKVALKYYEIKNSRLIYDDAGLGFYLSLLGLNHNGKGDFTSDLFTLSTITDADKLTLKYGGVSYLYNIKTAAKADLDMDMKNFKFTFKENQISLNDLVINFDGFIAMPGKDITMDLKFSTPKNDFKNFMSLIPGIYRDGFKDVKSSGSLTLNGFVKGTYNDRSMPGYGLMVGLGNGKFQYPSLPVPVNNVNMSLKIDNPDGVTDHVVVDLSKLHIELGAEPFDARLLIKTPISNASFDGMMKGKVNLANIGKMVPLEEGTSIAGLFVSDLSFNGNMKAIESKQYENVKADGSFTLTDFNYASKDYKQGMKLNKVQMTFNPKNITLNAFDAVIGKSDIQASGSLDNLLPFYFKKNELLMGTLNITSRLMDVNEMMGSSATANGTPAKATGDTSSMTALDIPEYIDFIMKASIGKIIYDNIILDNVKGNISIRDKTLGMNDVSFNTLDGSAVMNGVYNSRDLKNPAMNFDLDVKNMNIQKTVATFNTVKKMAPIAEKCSGTYSASFKVAGKLDNHMNAQMNTFNGGGKLQTGNVTLSNFEPISKLADALKMPQYKQMSLSNLNFSFKFSNGRVYVDPFDASLAGTKARIEGSNGFDQSIDYAINLAIPKSMLGSGATAMVTGLVSKIPGIGSNFSIPDPVNLKVNMGGTVSKPEIKTGLKEASKSITDDLKAKAQEELDKKKKELEDKAKAETDRLKKEAEAKAKAESDKLKKQAEDKLKKEAQDKLKNLFPK